MSDVSDSLPKANRKRKLEPDIEVDLTAPEPPSKKALRKAKKKSAKTEDTKTEGVQTLEAKQESREPANEPVKQRSNFGIWIGNLQFTTTQDDLRKFLTTQGNFKPEEITRINLPNGEKRHGKQQNKGFAYIDFSTSAAVQRAIALSEQLIGGRAVLIKDANNFAGRPDKPREDRDASKTSSNPPSRKIFVGNLAFDTTKQMLEEHYKPCGALSYVHIATFEDSGKCKGYGWVEFEELESAEAAVRGFVKVPVNEEMDDTESSGSDEELKDTQRKKKTQKKQKEKKVWVNRLLGRNLRADFAEDSTTRYKKRFGKEGPGKNDSSSRDRNHGQEEQTAPIEEVTGDRSGSSRRHDQKRTPWKPQAKTKTSSGGRYSEETVQRLSGSIVESQGKKTTFD